MEPNWQLIAQYPDSFRAQMAIEFLKDRGIAAVMIDKIDSSYVAIGAAEIYVPEENKQEAIELLKEFES